MGKIINIRDFVKKRYSKFLNQEIKAVDDQIAETMITGSCAACGSITSDLYEINYEWICTDCFKIGPFKVGM